MPSKHYLHSPICSLGCLRPHEPQVPLWVKMVPGQGAMLLTERKGTLETHSEHPHCLRQLLIKMDKGEDKIKIP